MSTLPIVNVLIVDDLEENLIALEALLRRDGIRVLQASSGIEALELLLAHDVALALLDVQMPEMDGFELAELMRGTERTRQVPIIFLTAGSHDSQRVFRGYEVGAVDFLFKPIDPTLLGHKVDTFVNLHRQRTQLADALRLNEMFMAVVSHDLRSPLSTVAMGAAFLERELRDLPAQRVATRIQSSAQRMAAMLDQLYDLTRARLAGGFTVTRKAIDARVLLDRVLEEVRGAHDERVLHVEYEGESFEGHWDENRLGQLAANLIGNALRYGTREVPVTVRVADSDGSLHVHVHNGGAIAAELLPQLFDPFRRGTTHGDRESLGLGLYIVREIAAAHGGTVTVASTPEAGTTFSVRLPR